MKTDVVKPQGVFFAPSRLVVPLFQRPYVWSKEAQWQPLWQDLVRLIEVLSHHSDTATHFLGAIVIQQVPGRLGALPAWNVIDGQQRLTTLQLLLDALHAELVGRGWESLAGRVLPLVENPRDHRDSEEDRFKLWPTNRDREAFTEVMSAPSPVDYDALPASRLRDAHRFFAESIAEWLGEEEESERRARLLVATVTDRLEIASISLDANEDAQAIFETLNARGTPLSAADLVKNFIFQQVDAAEAERAYLAHWADFETPWWEEEVTSGRVKNPRASLFLWQWLVARTLDDFPIREVFTQFKHYVNTVEKDVAALLPQIHAAASRYRAIIEGAENPVGPLTRTQLFSYRVGTLDSEVSRPLLIWLDEPEQAAITDDQRARLLSVLESWFVRRALVKASSQGSNRFIADLMQHLARQPHDRVADAAERFLADSHVDVGYWPGDAELRAALTDAPVYGKYRQSRLRMVFEAVEDAKRGYPGPSPLSMGPITRGKATIEHLMPQRWRRHWAADLNEVQELERDRRVQQLGNLTIVTQGLNSKVSNGSWAQKRAYLNEYDDVLITRDVLVSDEPWDEDAIVKRTQALIDRIIAVWPVPAGHVGLQVAAPPATRANVDVAQLVAAGWLAAGTRLVSRLQAAPGAEARVGQDGRIWVGDVAWDSPSGAIGAIHPRGLQRNGWWYWGLAGTERRLYEVRDDYLASLGEEDAAGDAAIEEAAAEDAAIEDAAIEDAAGGDVAIGDDDGGQAS